MIFGILKTNSPEIKGGTGWLNSQPLILKKLRGRVVLIDFWTYSCVNCLRTLPYLKKWYEKYTDKGLVIIGVHTPEFEFEKTLSNVRRAVENLQVNYPVVLDSKRRIWRAFTNSVWPRKFLIDERGRIRYDHSGEGAYEETEAMIQKLLREMNLKIELPGAFKTTHKHRFGQVCYPATGEIYCGFEQGICLNKSGFQRKKKADYLDSGNSGEAVGLHLQGRWYSGYEYLKHAGQSNSYEDYLRFWGKGVEINAVCEAGKPTRVEVKFEGEYLKSSIFGEDLQLARNGQTYFEVAGPRMYQIVKSGKYFAGNFQLLSNSEDYKIFALTFGGCPDS